MLNVFPREMEAIRQKENVMLDREKQFERSKQVTIAKNDDKHEETEIKEKNSTSKMTESAVQKVKMESKPQVVVDKKGLDVRVPVSDLGLSNLQGLVNIQFSYL